MTFIPAQVRNDLVNTDLGVIEVVKMTMSEANALGWSFTSVSEDGDAIIRSGNGFIPGQPWNP